MNTFNRITLPRRRVLMSGIPMALFLMLVFGTACGMSTSLGETPALSEPATGTATGGAPIGNAEAGQKIVQIRCLTCHSTTGQTIVGPTWKGLYGSKVELENGKTVNADAGYIKESIQNPNAKIVKGFAPGMPDFKGTLSDQQMNDIIAYIQTLQ